MKSRIYYFIFSILFILLLIQSGDIFFSPDSWTYLELSKTVFLEDFYKFKFQKSFATQEISTAYPFGYPILIAIFNLFIKNNVISMLVINGISIVSTIYLLKIITLKLKIETYFIFLSVIFSVAFLEEVLTGRSIPITILIYLIGINFFINGNKSISFFLLGLTAIFRFDFLVISTLTLIYFNFKNNFPLYKNLFFLLGLSPWVIFSFLKFNVLWASSSSWVATSSDYYSFVSDFNTSPLNMFENFPDFTTKLFINTRHFIEMFILNFQISPIIPILLFLVFMASFYYFKKDKLFYLLFIISISPYFLTGWFSARYFVIHSLIISAHFSFNTKLPFFKHKESVFIFIICCLSSFVFIFKMYTIMPNTIEEKKLIADLEKKQGNKNYVFYNARIGAKYSALTMKPATIFPTDFERLDSIQMNNFLLSLGEYEFICTE